MKPLLLQSVHQLTKTLTPYTEQGREALKTLSQEDVEALRTKHAPGSLVRLLATSRAVATWSFPAAVVVAFGALVGVYLLVGGFAGVVLSLATAVAVVVALFWAADRVVHAPASLSNGLEPLSKSPEQCVATLAYVKDITACREYRDAVVQRRELLQWDSNAIACLWRAEQARIEAERQAQAAVAAEAEAKDACRTLHGLSVASNA